MGLSKENYRTFDLQHKLPHLPVPTLSSTLTLYRETLVPLLKNEQLALSDAAIKAFRDDAFSNILQERLKEHAEHENKAGRSWLESWWLNKVYLEWRVPLVVNSNWWLLLRTSHLSKVNMSALSLPRSIQIPFTSIQILRAATLATNLLSFYALLVKGSIPPDQVVRRSPPGSEMRDDSSRTPLCMNQFRNVFGVTRSPRPLCDVVFSSFPAPRHNLTVLACNSVYSVDVSRYLPAKGSLLESTMQKESPYGVDRVGCLRHLVECLLEIAYNASAKADSTAVASLTAGCRDTWAKNHAAIRACSEKNGKNLELIEQSLFAISLDDNDPCPCAESVLALGKHVDVDVDVDTPTAQLYLRRMAHGNHSVAADRWYDKAINLVVTPSGHAGCCGEHSPQDALTPATVFVHAVLNEASLIAVPTRLSSSWAESTVPQSFASFCLRLDWDFKNFDIATKIADTKSDLLAATGDSDIELLVFEDFGSDMIKGVFKTSPDAFIQLSMQLAAFRSQDSSLLCSTYETASTRSFFHGRTEACRPASSSALRYVLAMQELKNATKDNRKKALLIVVNAFAEAAKNHSEMLARASSGLGVDRHLLGLRLLLRDGEKMPQIFTDAGFGISSSWLLSTSSLGSLCHKAMLGTGFGAVNQQGYGINYFLGPNQIRFGIESKFSCSSTSSAAMRDAIVTSLKDQRHVFDDYLNIQRGGPVKDGDIFQKGKY